MHRVMTVREVIQETPTVRTITFADDVMSAALPGQFAMVWVPGAGELPMSIMIHQTPGMAAFTVRRHGAASTGLFNVTPGSQIGVRGPYGNSFDVRSGKILLAGGGTGLVPLMRLLTVLPRECDVTVLIGARSRDELFFAGMPDTLFPGSDTVVTTNDGSYGMPGLVTDAADRLLESNTFDAVYTCGPELMMAGIVESARSHGVYVQASIERMMKCGVGICGSCCMAEDLVCRDGTVFDGDHLAKNPEFGVSYRDKSGISRRYQA